MKIEQVVGTIIALVIFASIIPTVMDSTKIVNSTLLQDLNQSYGSLFFTIFPVLIVIGFLYGVIHLLPRSEEVESPAPDEFQAPIWYQKYRDEEEAPTLETEVECPYCQTMYSRAEAKCPTCYAPRRRPST